MSKLEDDFMAGAETGYVKEKAVSTSISLPPDLLHKIEDLALSNKRKKLPDKTVSAIIKTALERMIIN